MNPRKKAQPFKRGTGHWPAVCVLWPPRVHKPTNQQKTNKLQSKVLLVCVSVWFGRSADLFHNINKSIHVFIEETNEQRLQDHVSCCMHTSHTCEVYTENSFWWYLEVKSLNSTRLWFNLLSSSSMLELHNVEDRVATVLKWATTSTLYEIAVVFMRKIWGPIILNARDNFLFSWVSFLLCFSKLKRYFLFSWENNRDNLFHKNSGLFFPS